jgi:hypothetical protein
VHLALGYGGNSAAIIAAAGHHSIEQNNDYVNMKDDHLKTAFKFVTPLLHGKPVENQSAASY